MTLQWLRGQDPPCPWSETTCIAAVEGGQLIILKWLRSQEPPCPWSEEACTAAAQGAQHQILEWLRTQGPPCPWSENTCTAAAYGCHLKTLQWLRRQDPPCPWSSEVCMAGKARNCQALLAWALLHGCPVDHTSPTEQALLETLCNRLVFLTCVAHMQNSYVQSTPVRTLDHHVLSLPYDVIMHIARLL